MKSTYEELRVALAGIIDNAEYQRGTIFEISTRYVEAAKEVLLRSDLAEEAQPLKPRKYADGLKEMLAKTYGVPSELTERILHVQRQMSEAVAEEAAPQKCCPDCLSRVKQERNCQRLGHPNSCRDNDCNRCKNAWHDAEKCPDVCPRCGSDDRTKYVLRSGAWSSCYESTHHAWHDAKPADLPDPLCSLCFGTGSWEGPGTVCKCVGRAKRPTESEKEK